MQSCQMLQSDYQPSSPIAGANHGNVTKCLTLICTGAHTYINFFFWLINIFLKIGNPKETDGTIVEKISGFCK